MLNICRPVENRLLVKVHQRHPSAGQSGQVLAKHFPWICSPVVPSSEQQGKRRDEALPSLINEQLGNDVRVSRERETTIDFQRKKANTPDLQQRGSVGVIPWDITICLALVVDSTLMDSFLCFCGEKPCSLGCLCREFSQQKIWLSFRDSN